MSADVLRKYLAHHAEPDILQLANFPPNQRFRHCVVIPAYDESAEFFTRLQLGPLHNKNTLCITVINQPDSAEDPAINKRLMHNICLSGEVLWQSEHLQLLHYSGSNNYWLVVDRFSGTSECNRPLPADAAVGLARKIGCDLAVALFARAQIASPWIHTTDADVFLPKDYFDLPDPQQYSAAIYRFKHQNDGSDIGRATAVYEQALEYYVRGLAWAGSPYAYHTLGSILAINASSYCHVGGFPLQSGTESFGLLNELAKLGPFYQTDSTLRIRARESLRTPSGTGAAVSAILALKDAEREYTCYHPQNFAALREWLRHIPKVWSHQLAQENPLSELSAPVREAVEAMGWHKILEDVSQRAKSATDAELALHNWFDAFRTQEFMQYLQHHYYPAVPLEESLRDARFVNS